jgi:putative transposase
MIRARAVKDPADWPESDYAEMMQTKQRYHLLNYETLGAMLGVTYHCELQLMRRRWIEDAVRGNCLARDSFWSESLAVGDEVFVVEVKAGLGFRGRKREVTKSGLSLVLREHEDDYGILPLKIPL